MEKQSITTNLISTPANWPQDITSIYRYLTLSAITSKPIHRSQWSNLPPPACSQSLWRTTKSISSSSDCVYILILESLVWWLIRTNQSQNIDLLFSMSMIYSLVARDQVVLTDYSAHQGNFSQVSLEVSHRQRRSSARPTCPKPSDSTSLPTTASIPSSKNDSSF